MRYIYFSETYRRLSDQYIFRLCGIQNTTKYQEKYLNGKDDVRKLNLDMSLLLKVAIMIR